MIEDRGGQHGSNGDHNYAGWMVAMDGRVLDDMEATGDLAPQWRESFAMVDRAGFLPDEFWLPASSGGTPRRVCRSNDAAQWQRWAHADCDLITRWNDETAVATSLAPRVVARILNQLDAQDGMSVLELGTGNGYGTALLSHRLGDKAVTSVEIDEALFRAARTSLDSAGYAPALRHDDAGSGFPERAPFDRLMATYAVTELPAAWRAQINPGGIVVTPWRNRLGNEYLMRFVIADGAARGTVVGAAMFPLDRAHHGKPKDSFDMDREATLDMTAVGPHWLTRDVDANLFISTRVNDCVMRTDSPHTVVADTVGGSWAAVSPVDDSEEWMVEQYGPRALWDEIEDAVFAFCDAGRPAYDRWRLLVDVTGTSRWLLSETG